MLKNRSHWIQRYAKYKVDIVCKGIIIILGILCKGMLCLVGIVYVL